MATQLAPVAEELPEALVPPASSEDWTAPRNYEAEALAHGWRPLEEFKGDPAQFVDAEAYVRRADEVLPFIKKQNKEFKGKIEFLERQIKKVMKSEQESYANALADVKAKMESAVVTGNVDAFNKLDQQAETLRKNIAADTPQADQQKEAIRAFASWRDDNEWYDLGGQAGATDTERRQRAYFDRMVEANEDKARTMEPADFIAHIGELVEAKYPASSTPRPKATESVAGVTRPSSGRGVQTYASLPPEYKRQADRFHEQGVYKGTLAEAREKYAKAYYAKDA